MKLRMHDSHIWNLQSCHCDGSFVSSLKTMAALFIQTQASREQLSGLCVVQLLDGYREPPIPAGAKEFWTLRWFFLPEFLFNSKFICIPVRSS